MGRNRKQVLSYVKEQARGNFRGAFWYDDEAWGVLELRNDLKSAELEAILTNVFQRLRDRGVILTGDEYEPLGEAEATAEIHEQGVMIHLVEAERKGMLVTLDRDAGRNLVEFVEQCNTFLRAG